MVLMLVHPQLIEKYRTVSRDILALPSIETFDMIRLDCEDLKRGLSDAAKDLANILLTRVTDDHRAENLSSVYDSYLYILNLIIHRLQRCCIHFRIISEFEMIQDRALQPPEDSEDLMSMVQFIENARSAGMIKLNERIRGAMDRLLYLMEAFLFEQGM